MQINKNIHELKSVYFIGIGGIGMSAIARYFYEKKIRVSGFDRSESPLTRQLVEEGIPVHYQEDILQVPDAPDLVVYTPAIPAGNKELEHCREKKYLLLKRSDVLQWITNSTFNICVAGTHGKTTISTMVAHLLRDSGYGCNAFLGGISANYGTNFWSDKNHVCVIEADEYDRSFLKLNPDMAIVSAMDADHLDIYDTAANVQQAYIDFAGNIKNGGLLIKKFGLSKELVSADQMDYSLQNDVADAYAEDIQLQDGGYRFNAVVNGKKFKDLVLNMGGMHNVENMIAAITVAEKLNIAEEKISKAVKGFKGVKRRFEYVIKSASLVFIDDYAHHPEELKALVNGARSLFPQRKITIVFQPHLYSRTRDFAGEFAEVLAEVDEIILLPIYPAREQPIEGVDSDLIAGLLHHKRVRVMTKDELLVWLENDFSKNYNREFGEVFITAGAGDIGILVDQIKNSIEK